MCDVGECARYFSSWHPVPVRPYSYDIRKCVISLPYFGNKIVRRQKVRPSMVCSLYVSIFFLAKDSYKEGQLSKTTISGNGNGFLDFLSACIS
jgi:hypothetical protein